MSEGPCQRWGEQLATSRGTSGLADRSHHFDRVCRQFPSLSKPPLASKGPHLHPQRGLLGLSAKEWH